MLRLGKSVDDGDCVATDQLSSRDNEKMMRETSELRPAATQMQNSYIYNYTIISKTMITCSSTGVLGFGSVISWRGTPSSLLSLGPILTTTQTTVFYHQRPLSACPMPVRPQSFDMYWTNHHWAVSVGRHCLHRCEPGASRAMHQSCSTPTTAWYQSHSANRVHECPQRPN